MHSIAINKTIESWQPRFSLFLFLEQSRRVFVRSSQNLIRALAGCQLQATGNCQGSPIHLPRAWHGDFLIFSEDWFYFKCQCTKICRTSDLMVLRKSMARLEFVFLGPAMHGYLNCGLQATILADNIQHPTRCWLCHIWASFFNYPFFDVKLGWWSVGEVPVDTGPWIRWLLQWSLWAYTASRDQIHAVAMAILVPKAVLVVRMGVWWVCTVHLSWQCDICRAAAANM
jgi:hypothetical protein